MSLAAYNLTKHTLSKYQIKVTNKTVDYWQGKIKSGLLEFKNEFPEVQSILVVDSQVFTTLRMFLSNFSLLPAEIGTSGWYREDGVGFSLPVCNMTECQTFPIEVWARGEHMYFWGRHVIPDFSDM